MFYHRCDPSIMTLRSELSDVLENGWKLDGNFRGKYSKGIRRIVIATQNCYGELLRGIRRESIRTNYSIVSIEH